MSELYYLFRRSLPYVNCGSEKRQAEAAAAILLTLPRSTVKGNKAQVCLGHFVLQAHQAP